jgi:hypothetical protein
MVAKITDQSKERFLSGENFPFHDGKVSFDSIVIRKGASGMIEMVYCMSGVGELVSFSTNSSQLNFDQGDTLTITGISGTSDYTLM